MRTRWPARTCAFAVILVLALVVAGEGADGSVKTILSDPGRFDGQAVTLGGTVTQLDARVSKRGNSYYTFKLDDGSGRITVFSFGQPPCPSPNRVTVDGEFRHVKRVGAHTFYDQVDARRVVCR
jgi:DNA polymerase III alpha subunit